MTPTPPQSAALPSPSRAWYQRPLVWLLIAALLGGSVWWRHHRAATQAADAGAASSEPARGGGKWGGKGMADRPQPVIVANAIQTDVGVFLNGLGTVTARNTVTVKPRVDGELQRITFQEGQIVQAGQLLAEIDPRPFQIQLTQAEGQLARDQALLKNAHIDLERYRTLVAQDSATRQQLDTQEALVRQYEGAVKTDQGQIDSAHLQLAYAKVTAPISGRLGLRQVDAGNVVHASDANGLVVITQVQPINVMFTLPEKDIAPVLKKIQAGESLTVDALDRDQKARLAVGRLATLDNQIDTATGTLKFKAEFPNTDNALFPNQFANIRLRVDTRAQAVVIPGSAIQRGTPGTYVYVVQANKTVSVRPVTPGPIDGEQVVIDKGLAAGEQVVVDGADKLREGAKVEPVTREAAARAAQGGGQGRRHGGPGGASASSPAAKAWAGHRRSDSSATRSAE